ncbi:MAG: hypothetical protein K6G22_13500 [Lachnospiraceae bacterium]|nr:hypothetical protein [Lachnospiraceae bacterium]
MEELESLYYRYFKETERDKRDEALKSLESAIAECGDTDELSKLSCIKEIYELRYLKRRKGILTTDDNDNFLFQCINLPYLCKNTMFFSITTKKRLNEALVSLGLNDYGSFSEQKKELLHREYRNTAACYIKTCDASSYRSLFGIIPADDKTRKKQMVADFYDMTKGASTRFSLDDKLDPWIKAVTDELFSTSSEYRELYERIG